MSGSRLELSGRLSGLLREYRRYGYYTVSLLLFLLAWEVGSQLILQSLLPGVVPVGERMVAIVASGAFFSHLLDTLRRVAVGFLLAYGVSVPLGIAMGFDERFEYFFDIPILIGISVPGLAVAVIAIIWFGLSEMAAFVSVFILATPMIVFNFWQGAKSIDENLLRMGDSFELSRTAKVRHIVLPSLLPQLLAAARFGLAMSWKIVVIVELLGLTSGIGYMINNQFQLYSITGVLAWTLTFTLVMMTIEFGVLKNVERRVTQWRGTGSVNGGPRE
ncbi:ABC transporter permease [Halobacterium noricense]|uniref:ABC transporter permease n=1 Tax=Halobacterium noricense TaxID=223182 RepID=UPI001E3CE63C|nr:ABC transporter permease [Halobacterium noricense]UHH24786.1 ABC transporter permease [Halobacterium noricense]